MHIGIIGAAGGQGRRILNLHEVFDVEFVIYDHHGESVKLLNMDRFQITRCMEGLLKCDGVVIASPNESHMQYLQYFILNHYRGYIYCEKPPVSNAEDLMRLENVEESVKKKILFGFNLERSLYRDILDGIYSIGNLLYCNIISGHGLGFKPFYKNSWRNDVERCKNGIFEVVSIHYLEMFIAKYGMPKEKIRFGYAKAPGGINIDNNLYSAVWSDENIMLSLYVSYTTPYIERSSFIFDNGYIMITENDMTVYGPRDCFDKGGLFKSPDVITRSLMGTNQIWEQSIRNNFGYFLDKVKNGEEIPVEEFNNAVIVNKYLLGIAG